MSRTLLFAFSLLIVFSCRKAPKNPESCSFTNDDDNYFSIIDNSDSPDRAFNVFCKKVDVFGIMLYATDNVTDENLLHSANLMAQYIDNDEDGNIDDQLVLDSMRSHGSCMSIFGTDKSSVQRRFFRHEASRKAQDLYNSEIHPGGRSGDTFDAALEEILHLVTATGWSKAYPETFWEKKGSRLCNAMDIARGGQHESIPNNYPSDAWYHYNDKTCEYQCMATEYFYWALTTHLGAQIERCGEINQEWEICTSIGLQSKDKAMFELITDSTYNLPKVPPDGSYMR